MSKLKILGIRRIRKDKGFGRLTSTSYIDGKKVSKKTKKYKIVKQGVPFIDETGGSMYGKHHRDLPEATIKAAYKWFKG